LRVRFFVPKMREGRMVRSAEFDSCSFRISARRAFKSPLVVIDLVGRRDA